MGNRIAIDFGTSNTSVAVAGRVVLVDGSPLMPSAVYAAADGTLFVGQDAQRQAAIDPARFEPHPKRRVDEGELLLGPDVWAVGRVVRAILSRCLQEVRRGSGGQAVDELVLTHPAGWGTSRREILRGAGSGLAAAVRLVPEPVAAAFFFATLPGSPAAAGAPLAVLDIGGGTTDASVVRRGPTGWEVLATRGDDTFGGTDIDEALVRHLGATVRTDRERWTALVTGLSLPERRRRRVLYADARTAKEALSRHAYADVPMPEPFADAQVTRDELESLVGDRIDGVVRLLRATIADSRLREDELGGVYLVGGSSRIPLVARRIRELMGLDAIALEQAETVVVRGALLAGAPPVPPLPPPSRRAPSPRPAPSPLPTSTPAPAAAGPQTAERNLVAAQQGPKTANRFRLAGIAVVVLASAVGLGWWLSDGGDDSEPDPAATSREIAQYDYRFAIPAGWEQSGGDPAARQVRISPAGAAGPTAVLVQQNLLDFDSAADPGLARDRLADLVAAADPAQYAGPADTRRIAGRELDHYRQLPPGGGAVDWYVVFDGRIQVTVGCRTAATGADVAAACERVVGSLQVGR